MKWIEMDRQIEASGVKILSLRQFRQVTGVGPVAAKFLLIRYTKRGLLIRLKRGLYAVKARMPSTWAIANRLYTPSYVSLETALSHYGMIPETVYAVTSVTTRATREFEVQGIAYIYQTIKWKAFAEYRGMEIDGQPVLIAEKEKALADYLYFVFLKKHSLNDRLSLRGIAQAKLRRCIECFDSPRFLRWFHHDFKIPGQRIIW